MTHEAVSPVVDSVRVYDLGVAADRSNPARESSHYSRFDWVDPKVTRFSSLFKDSSFISSFVHKVCLMKPDAVDGILAVDLCHPADTICISRSPTETTFFFAYSCLFYDLHLALPFDDFTMGVLRELNISSSQLYPNSWASL